MMSAKYIILALSIVTETSLPRRAIRGASRRCLTLEKSRPTAFGVLATDVHGSKATAARLLSNAAETIAIEDEG